MSIDETLDRLDHEAPQTLLRKQCVACREAIHPDARMCPHCHSAQYRSNMKTLADILKWVGGTAAVLSLLMGMLQLNSIFRNWRDRQGAVSELVKAAGIQKQTGDYPGAWRLLEEALELEPGSKPARAIQVQVAMRWLRNIRKDSNQSFKDIIKKLLPALYRGATSADKRAAADGFAHLGWANYLQYREGMTGLDVDAQFQRALDLDSANLYAHTMWGHWMLWPGNSQEYDGGNLNRAVDHFEAALKSGQEKAYIRNMQFHALFNSGGVDIDVESIKLANEMRKQHETIKYGHRKRIIETYTILLYTNQYAEKLSQKLTAALPYGDLLETLRWLVEKQDTRDNLSASQVESCQILMAYFTEQNDDLQGALAMYRSLKGNLRPNSALHARVDQAIDRILQETKQN